MTIKNEDASFIGHFREFVLNDTYIDWRYWVGQMPRLDASQAARLINGLDPDIFADLDNPPNTNNNPTDACSNARRIERLAIACGMNSATPRAWLDWADSLEWDDVKGFRIHELFRSEVGRQQANVQAVPLTPVNGLTGLPFVEALQEPEYQKTPEYRAEYARAGKVHDEIKETENQLTEWGRVSAGSVSELDIKEQKITALKARIAALNASIFPQKPQAAPVVADSAPGGVVLDQAGPVPVEQGLSTKDIAHAFDGVNGWSADRWPRNLSSSKWLHPARIALGTPGGASAVWNPLMLAQLMHDNAKGEREKEKLMKVFNSRFTLNPALRPWRDVFNEYFATYCATD